MLKGSVRTLASQRSDKLRDLIRDLLAQALQDANSGNTKRAQRAVEIAPALLAVAAEHKTPAPSEYFREWVETLNRVKSLAPGHKMSNRVYESKIVLAEYRSAIQARPQPPDPDDVRRGPEGREIIGLKGPRKLERNIRVIRMTLVGGAQTLDGTHRTDVVFINTHIKYLGGEVSLSNVVFVNCTFDIAESDVDERLAEHVALRSPSFLIRADV